MNVGDVVIHTPCMATSYGEHKVPPTRGVVVWIHPKNRFYRVRFTVEGGSWIECFPCHQTEKERTETHENDCNSKPERRNRKNSIDRDNGSRYSRIPQKTGHLY